MVERPPDIQFEMRGAPWTLLKRLARLAKNPPAEPPIIEALIAGPGGSGKSWADAMLFYWIGMTWPGCKLLVLRDKRVDLAASFQKIFEEHVVPAGHPMLKKPRDRVSRRAYNFWNGPRTGKHPTIGASILELGGMDNITRHRSTSYDAILFVEMSELMDEEEWGELTRRSLRGYLTSGMPFQLALGETNPDAPDHWIKLRCERGAMELLESRHEDNPALWDRETRTWTPNGKAYIASLDMMPEGPRKQRIRWGRWFAAEGVVYENFDRRRHIVSRAPPSELDIRWYCAAMDWGYRDACCLLIGGIAGDGTVYIVEEYFLTGDAARIDEGMIYGSLDWWARLIAAKHKEYDLYGLVVDPSKPEAIDQFNLVCGYSVDKPWARGANNKRASSGEGDMGGIDLVRKYLADGKLKFFDDALQHEPDKNLMEQRRCFRTTMEFGQYVYRKSPRSGVKLQNAAKELTDPTCSDHGMDDVRYLLTFVDGRDGERARTKQIADAMTPEDRKVAEAMGRSVHTVRAPEPEKPKPTLSKEDAEIMRTLGRRL